MIIFSERYLTQFQELSEETGRHTDIITNDATVVLSSLTKGDGKLVLDVASDSAWAQFLSFVPAMNKLIQSGAIKSIKILASESREDAFINSLAVQGTSTLVVVVRDTITDAALKKLYMEDTPNNFYVAKESRRPSINTGKSIEDQMAQEGTNLINTIYSVISGTDFSGDGIKEAMNQIDNKVSLLTNQIDVTDPKSPARITCLNEIGNLVKGMVVLDNAEKIVSDSYAEAKDITATTAETLREQLRRKEAMKDKDEIVALVESTRKTYQGVVSSLTNHKNSMSEVVNLVATLSIPSQEKLLSLSDDAIGFITTEEIQEALSLIPTITAKQKKVQKLMYEKLQSLMANTTELQKAMNEVVKGYEKAVEASFSLIDDLMASSTINIEVLSLTEKYITLVGGISGTGITNYALSTAVSIADRTLSCVIDFKESSPQLHYYCPDAITMESLLTMDRDSVEQFIEEHYKVNNTLCITFPKAPVELTEVETKHRYKELLSRLLHFLASKNITTFVIVDIFSNLFGFIAKQAATISIVSDLNISNLSQLNTYIARCKKQLKLQQYNLVVTGITTTSPKSYLVKAGVKVGSARVVGIPILPNLDDYKISGKIYALDNNSWRY